MRPIPSSLESKLKQAFQTIHGNADPKMDIIAQKVQKYLTEGTFLQPRTIRTGDSLGPLDICIRREDVNSDPTEIVMAYIENGVAKVATLPYVHKPDEEFTYKYTIGPAVDVACDFDGRWHRITDRTGIYFDTSVRWALTTFGEPYIATVRADGSLYVQQGESGQSLQLAADNVSKVAALRAWKNVMLYNHDQGLIVAYIRNGEVCYRNYCQQPDGQSTIWETEKTVTELPSPAQHISLFRTNDYRMGFMTESNGQMYWAITARDWSGMAVPPEKIAVSITDYDVDLLPIKHKDAYAPAENIAASIQDYEANLCPNIYPQLVSVYNPAEDAETIILEFDMGIENHIGQQAAFTLTDTGSNTFTVLSTAQGATANLLVLTVAPFTLHSGDITVDYSDTLGTLGAVVQGGCFMRVASFSDSFTPDLAPPAPPEGMEPVQLNGSNSGWTPQEKLAASITNYEASLTRINRHEGQFSEKLAASITNYEVELIHVSLIDP